MSYLIYMCKQYGEWDITPPNNTSLTVDTSRQSAITYVRVANNAGIVMIVEVLKQLVVTFIKYNT